VRVSTLQPCFDLYFVDLTELAGCLRVNARTGWRGGTSVISTLWRRYGARRSAVRPLIA
jgi:hypothetical protein